jgi:hypothetical protein
LAHIFLWKDQKIWRICFNVRHWESEKNAESAHMQVVRLPFLIDVSDCTNEIPLAITNGAGSSRLFILLQSVS